MNFDQPSREQIEVRITALLLGELPAEEAALLRYTLAQDPALQQLHDQLQAALGLVREVAKHPAEAPLEKGPKRKLSKERRRILLEHFKTPRPTPKPEPLFWLNPIPLRLVHVLAAVAIIAVLAAMLLPSLSAAKRKAAKFAVINEATRAQSLQDRTWAADNSDKYPAAPATVAPPVPAASAPEVVTVAPEPVLAPPPTPIFLPHEPATYTVTTAGLAGTGSGSTGSLLPTPQVHSIVDSFDHPAPVPAMVPGQSTSFALNEPTARGPVYLAAGGGDGDGGGGGGGQRFSQSTPDPGAGSSATMDSGFLAAPKNRGIPPVKQPDLVCTLGAEVNPIHALPDDQPTVATAATTASVPPESQTIPAAGMIELPKVAGGDSQGINQAVETMPTVAESDQKAHGSHKGGVISQHIVGYVNVVASAAASPLQSQSDPTAGMVQSPKSEPKKEPGIRQPEAIGVLETAKPVPPSEGAFSFGGTTPAANSSDLNRKDAPGNSTLAWKNADRDGAVTPLTGQHTFMEEQRLPGVSQAASDDAAYERSLIEGQRQREQKAATPLLSQNSAGVSDQIVFTNSFALNGSPSTYSPATSFVPNKGQKEEMIQPGLTDFEGVENRQAVDIYAKLANRTLLPSDVPPGQMVLRQEKPMAKTEAKNLVLGMLASNGVAMVNIGDKYVKAIPSDQASAAGAAISRYPAKPTLDVDTLKTFDQTKIESEKSAPYDEAKRDLAQKQKMHELLYAKLATEKADMSLPKSLMVQITDKAEPVTNQTFWQRLSGQYASTASMKIENDVSDIAPMNGSQAPQSFGSYFIQTTFEIMKSDMVLAKVVNAMALDKKWGESKAAAAKDLRRRLALQPVPNTKLISISAESADPNEAADLANAVAKAYKDYRYESRRALTTNGLMVLENQYAQQEQEIKLAQEKVERLAGKSAPEAIATPAEPDIPIRKPAPNTPLPQPEILTSSNAFSTFSLNVSDVSFKFAEASLQNGRLPDTASIRSEEFINAFDYRDPEAAPGQPMAFMSERARYPFAQNRELLRFAVKTAAAGRQSGRALNLVLLLDNSGSMERADRVAIIREALRVLATQLQPQDTVSIVTFARTARLWADGLRGDQAGATLERVGEITPEGGTNLEEAMRLAYETARRHYLPDGMNRVVLLTDGAANLGNVDPDAFKQKADAQRQQGIALDCFGIGWEDLNDDLLELLSSNGGGRYAFLNSPEDVAKEFAAKLAGALQITAADVKVQVEFNPDRVISYRQIGYAKHQLTKEQFRDNTVAAGEIAAQEAGNALYTVETNPNGEGPVATVHVRYRIPGTQDYREHSWDVAYTGGAPALDQSSAAMRLAATAGAFSEWLAASPYAQAVTLDELQKLLRGVPEIYGADDRPKQLETMIQEARSLEGH